MSLSVTKHPERGGFDEYHSSFLPLRKPTLCNETPFIRGFCYIELLDELKARILKGVAEINAAPVVHRWKNFKALEQE